MRTERLLRDTGLQYIHIKEKLIRNEPGQAAVDLLNEEQYFFRQINHNERRPPNEFSWTFITPHPNSTGDGNYFDSWNEPISPERLFAVTGETAFKSLSHKWLPVPFTARETRNGIQEIDSNNWVRLWFSRPSVETIDLVLCVDTSVVKGPINNDFSGFPENHLNHLVSLHPTSSCFWRSTFLKAAVASAGAHIKPVNDNDFYPEYSHYIALLNILSKFRFLPKLELITDVGAPFEVHLFLDVGNTRTCGILAENKRGSNANVVPRSFEKLAIRNVYKPNEVYDEPFETCCAFMPSPFDGEFFSGLDWSPNFRIPSLMRLGNTVRTEEQFVSDLQVMRGQAIMSSPKRYLWSKELEPDPWFFSTPTRDGRDLIIRGEILNQMDDKGCPRSITGGSVPHNPQYPRSAMMTFFMIEILYHVFSQINSTRYRNRKGNPDARRLLKSIVIVTPNGMVRAEKKIRISSRTGCYPLLGLLQHTRPHAESGIRV